VNINANAAQPNGIMHATKRDGLLVINQLEGQVCRFFY